MKTIILILILSSITLYGQKDSSSVVSSPDIFYGYRIYSASFYNQLNTVNKISLNRPLQTIGIGLSGYFSSTPKIGWYGHLIYSQVIPQTIFIQDTIKGKITGFVFGAAFGRALKTKKENFALLYCLGFNTGRLRMYDNQFLKQRNAFFSPKISIQPKIKIGRLALSFLVEYEYDISKPIWKKTLFSKDYKTQINNLRQTCLTGQIGLGYIW